MNILEELYNVYIESRLSHAERQVSFMSVKFKLQWTLSTDEYFHR